MTDYDDELAAINDEVASLVADRTLGGIDIASRAVAVQQRISRLGDEPLGGDQREQLLNAARVLLEEVFELTPEQADRLRQPGDES